MSRRLGLAVGAALIAATAVGGLAWASSLLPLPSASQLADLGGWHREVGTAHAVMVLLRLVATALSCWIAVGGTLQLLAGAWPRLRRVADAVSPSMVRGVAGGMASLSLGVVAAPGLGPEPEASTAVLQPIEDGTSPSSTTATSILDGRASLRPLEDGETGVPSSSSSSIVASSDPSSGASVGPSSVDPTSTTTEPVVRPAEQHPPAPPAIPAPAPPPTLGSAPGTPVDRHVVTAGDHFWSLAHELVVEAKGSMVAEREVARYWTVLVAANRDRLVVPGEPDLLFVGQELVIPPVD